MRSNGLSSDSWLVMWRNTCLLPSAVGLKVTLTEMDLLGGRGFLFRPVMVKSAEAAPSLEIFKPVILSAYQV